MLGNNDTVLIWVQSRVLCEFLVFLLDRICSLCKVIYWLSIALKPAVEPRHLAGRQLGRISSAHASKELVKMIVPSQFFFGDIDITVMSHVSTDQKSMVIVRAKPWKACSVELEHLGRVSEFTVRLGFILLIVLYIWRKWCYYIATEIWFRVGRS